MPDLDDFYRGDYINDIAARVHTQYPDIFNLSESQAIDICFREAVDEILAGIKTDLADFRVRRQDVTCLSKADALGGYGTLLVNVHMA